MDITTILSAILMLIAGIGIFLVACQAMSSNLESLSSEKLKRIFSRTSRSRWIGVGISTLGTAAIQSSGAITVMVIGFVNAGILSLTQAATIIYGANIGTTVTAQIVALGMFGGGMVSSTVIFSSFAGVGAFVALFAKSEKWKKIGGVLTGFGMLFVGLSMMSGSMEDFARLDAVKTFLAGINNILLLVLIGTVMTAIIQSSSVTTSVTIAMVFTDLITLDQGIYLTMGSNIGSCVVAIIAGMTSSKNAKRTALIHLIFNCSGVIIFLILGCAMSLFSGGSVTLGTVFCRLFPDTPQVQLAMFHTAFNVCTVLIVMPLTDQLVKLVCRIIKDEKKEDDEDSGPRLCCIDEHMLTTPPVAVAQTKREIQRMAGVARTNFDIAIHIVTTLDFARRDEFKTNEHTLNYLNRAIVAFVIRLSEQPQLSERDHVYLSNTFRVVRDVERIGDYAENIVEYADELQRIGRGFSAEAIKEIKRMHQLIMQLFERVMEIYMKEDMSGMPAAYEIEDLVDELAKSMEDNHIRRMSKGECDSSVGAQYLSLSSNTERIADHLINVAKSVKALSQMK